MAASFKGGQDSYRVVEPMMMMMMMMIMIKRLLVSGHSQEGICQIFAC
jgi:hypothetical protein